MLRKSFAMFLLMLAFAADAKVPWPLEIIDYFDGTTLVIFVTEADVEASPVWDPATGTPPFDLAEVLAAVGKWKDENDCSDQDRIEKIELKPIAHHEKEGRWYYLVQLKNQKKGRKAHHYLAVLMNGKTVAAIREPESYK